MCLGFLYLWCSFSHGTSQHVVMICIYRYRVIHTFTHTHRHIDIIASSSSFDLPSLVYSDNPVCCSGLQPKVHITTYADIPTSKSTGTPYSLPPYGLLRTIHSVRNTPFLPHNPAKQTTWQMHCVLAAIFGRKACSFFLVNCFRSAF